MPEHDAFGREIGEDPLADLGWGTSKPVPPAVRAQEPAAAPPTTMPAPAPVFLPVPGAGGRSVARTIRWVVSLAVLGAVVLGAVTVVSAGKQAIEDITDVVPGVLETGDGDPAPSLLRRAPLERALATLAAEAPGRLTTLRLDAGRISLTQYARGNELRVITMDAGDRAPTVVSTSDTGAPPVDVFAYEDLRPKAVARALRVAQERTGKGPARIDYLVFTAAGGKGTWGVYYRGGQIVQTDARGRFVRQVN